MTEVSLFLVSWFVQKYFIFKRNDSSCLENSEGNKASAGVRRNIYSVGRKVRV